MKENSTIGIVLMCIRSDIPQVIPYLSVPVMSHVMLQRHPVISVTFLLPLCHHMVVR